MVPMSDKGQKAQHEPSMEEILASIRQIISEDDPQEGDRAPPGGTGPGGTGPGGTGEVFDLTRMVNEDGSVTDLRAPPAPPAQAARPTPADRSEDGAPPQRPEPPAATRPMVREEMAADEDGPEAEEQAETREALVSPRSAAEAREAFHHLYGSTRLRRDGGPDTLEDLVADLLRPMLKEWLDANLPTLVEELVEKEIARLARRGRG
jgi:hypothetical protein